MDGWAELPAEGRSVTASTPDGQPAAPPATSAPAVPGTGHVVPDVPRFRFLGTFVDGFTVESFLRRISDAVACGESLLVANHNVNSLTLLQREDRFAAFYARAQAVFIDGMAVVLIGRLLGEPVQARHRVAVLDWIWPLCDLAHREGWHLVHLGGTERGLAQARASVLLRYPGLALTTLSGYFDPHDPQANAAVLQHLRDSEPTVLLVGMGMPRQEHWLLDNLDALPDTVVVTVGGILSFLGGERPTPPRWTGRLGIEWLFRLVTEPRRLWRRYLLEPLALMPVLSRELRARPRRAPR